MGLLVQNIWWCLLECHYVYAWLGNVHYIYCLDIVEPMLTHTPFHCHSGWAAAISNGLVLVMLPVLSCPFGMTRATIFLAEVEACYDTTSSQADWQCLHYDLVLYGPGQTWKDMLLPQLDLLWCVLSEALTQSRLTVKTVCHINLPNIPDQQTCENQQTCDQHLVTSQTTNLSLPVSMCCLTVKHIETGQLRQLDSQIACFTSN